MLLSNLSCFSQNASCFRLLLTEIYAYLERITFAATPLSPEREREREAFYMFPPNNKSDHMQQGLMTLHHMISLQQ